MSEEREDLTYNRISGKSVERIAALSDGLFAIAMTLLIIELHTPVAEAIGSESDLWQGIVALSPRLLMYAISFMTLGIFWVGQQTQLGFLTRSDRHLTWIHLAFLAGVALFPFSTALMAEFLTYRVALIIYWLTILIPGIALYAGLAYARRVNLLKEDAAYHAAAKVLQNRVLIAQGLYAFGAALCFFSTYLSIGFILIVQLNYAIAPTWRGK